MLWFVFFFGLFFLNQFKFFKLGWNFQTRLKFSNQFIFFFGHLSIKRENIFLRSSILFSPILAEFLLIYYIPQLLLPLPPNSH